MSEAVIITANYGRHDDAPRPPIRQLDVDVEWLYYTDDGTDAPSPWVTIHASPRYPDSPNLSAKIYKTEPPVNERDVIWIDANMEIRSAHFVVQALASRRDGVAVFAHPRRSCIYTEAEASVGSESQGGKYDALALAGQTRSYLSEGYPAANGLYACGVVAWDLTDERARVLGDMWMAECARWSPQDQLSFPVACWRLGVTPGVFPISQIERRWSSGQFLGNRWLRIWPHNEKP